MKLGIQSLQFTSDPGRRVADQIDDAIEVLHEADRLGFDWVSASQHWVSAPTRWPQPFPLLARLAPEVPHMRLMTQMLILPLHHPVDTAEQISTLDHCTRGRLTVGCAIGYREVELESAGISRKDRVSRMEESISLMKLLWSGETVHHNGKWWTLNGGQAGFTPFQQPHPPLVLAAQSEAAARRAARIGNGVFFGPQVSFASLRHLVRLYGQAAAEYGTEPAVIGAGRSVMLASTKEEAIKAAREYANRTMSMYSGWDMQERGMAALELDDRDIASWALVGSPQDIVEGIVRAAQDVGLNHITLTAYNLPKDQRARIEYVQQLGEEVVTPVKKLLGELSDHEGSVTAHPQAMRAEKTR
jgi:alkanesulfonate monooxygenase SsuD/methylene tetrahydromethanopterin reductase-like flavin-dependent oxidoreductase (luciferase family)